MVLRWVIPTRRDRKSPGLLNRARESITLPRAFSLMSASYGRVYSEVKSTTYKRDSAITNPQSAVEKVAGII